MWNIESDLDNYYQKLPKICKESQLDVKMAPIL